MEREKVISSLFYITSFFLIILYPFNQIPSISPKKVIIPFIFLLFYLFSKKRIFFYLFFSLILLQPMSFILNKIYSIGIEKEPFIVCNGDFCFSLSDLCSGWLEVSGIIFLSIASKRKKLLILVPIYILYNFFRIRLLYLSKSFLIHNIFWLPSLIFFIWIVYLIIKI